MWVPYLARINRSLVVKFSLQLLFYGLMQGWQTNGTLSIDGIWDTINIIENNK